MIAPDAPAPPLRESAVRAPPIVPLPKFKAPFESAVKSRPIVTVPKVSAFTSVIATSNPPVLSSVTAPLKSLLAPIKLINAAPVVKLDVPPTIIVEVASACSMGAPEVIDAVTAQFLPTVITCPLLNVTEPPVFTVKSLPAVDVLNSRLFFEVIRTSFRTPEFTNETAPEKSLATANGFGICPATPAPTRLI